MAAYKEITAGLAVTFGLGLLGFLVIVISCSVMLQILRGKKRMPASLSHMNSAYYIVASLFIGCCLAVLGLTIAGNSIQ